MQSTYTAFENLRTSKQPYIDKTELIYNLFAYGERYFFLSRPPKFGKSLLASTLACLFESKKELFTDLWIASSDFDWKSHPVIYVDFQEEPIRTSKELTDYLSRKLITIANNFDIHIDKPLSIESTLDTLVDELALKYGTDSVVFLMDDYDKPILNNIHDSEFTEECIEILTDFLSTLNGLRRHLRAIFIIGTLKTQVIAELDNITDLSLSEEAATLVGFTQEELSSLPRYEYYFSRSLKSAYRPVEDPICVEKHMHNINKYQFSKRDLFGGNLTKDAPLLYQTGMLTIADYDDCQRYYRLKHPKRVYPNHW